MGEDEGMPSFGLQLPNFGFGVPDAWTASGRHRRSVGPCSSATR